MVSFRSNRPVQRTNFERATGYQTEYDQADYFTLREREQLYDASLRHGDPCKDVEDISQDELDELKRELAQSMKKPKEEVTDADIRKRQKAWKLPSLVSVALDLGLRPIEIERFKVSWFRPGKSTIYIPSEQAAKNDANWEVGLSSRSDRVLRWWIKQRENREAHDHSDKMWLNNAGNPYNTNNLNYHLRKLIELTDIDVQGRTLNFYSIRRSTGVYLTYFHSLAYTKEQLRHKSLSATLDCVEFPVEVRQQVLDQLQGGLPLTESEQAAVAEP